MINWLNVPKKTSTWFKLQVVLFLMKDEFSKTWNLVYSQCLLWWFLSVSLLILVVVHYLMYMTFDVSEVYFTIVVESFMWILISRFPTSHSWMLWKFIIHNIDFKLMSKISSIIIYDVDKNHTIVVNDTSNLSKSWRCKCTLEGSKKNYHPFCLWALWIWKWTHLFHLIFPKIKFEKLHQ